MTNWLLELTTLRQTLTDALRQLDALAAQLPAEAARPVPPPPALPVESRAPVPPPALVINEEWKQALEAMRTGREPLFITGGAGTGKSTLLRHFVEQHPAVVLAPTGVAALRAGGATIHRFFGFGPHLLQETDIQRVSDSRRAKYKALETLIIDEISMVRADMMDAIDLFLQRNGPRLGQPFGGVRVIYFGDLFQLPPVAKDPQERRYLQSRYGDESPYFFHALAWERTALQRLELNTIFRQKDPRLTDALNAMRQGTASADHIGLLNSRVQATFQPSRDELWITLTTTNMAADARNIEMLAAIPGPARTFVGVLTGEFDRKNLPTDEGLALKVGAAVMFVRNHAEGHWVNGTLGRVVSIEPLRVEIDGQAHEVGPEKWESYGYDFAPATGKIERRVTGTFTQIPLKLAAAITIHKAQGLTFDRCVIDLGSGAFAAGQTYVALSRCRTLEGMVLRRPVRADDLIVSPAVQAFMRGERVRKPVQPSLLEAGS